MSSIPSTAIINNMPIQNINLPRLNAVKLNSLRNLVKVLYDDISYEIINYIINLNGAPAEEQKLADELNFSYTQVRQSLIQMEKHGILLSSEFKRKKEEEEDEFLPGFQSMRNQVNKGMPVKKNKTSEWKINDTYYNRIKHRFADLKLKLEANLKEREKLKFECSNPKCPKKIYMDNEAARRNYICTNCEDKPKLVEKKPE